MAKRVFISFDFDNDKQLKEFIVGQSRNPNSPFEIYDWSLKEAVKEAKWKQEAREKIKRSDLVIVMLGQSTYKAPGVLAEVQMAREEGIKLAQVVGYSNVACPSVIDAGVRYNWSWDNLAKILS